MYPSQLNASAQAQSSGILDTTAPVSNTGSSSQVLEIAPEIIRLRIIELEKNLSLGELMLENRKFKEAIIYFEAALKIKDDPTTKENLSEVQFTLGKDFLSKKEWESAIPWFEKAVKNGNAKAMYNLGWLYSDGQGVAQSYPDAAKWYQAAAEKGIPGAMHNLGRLYSDGQGVAQSYPDAAKWYQAAAEKGEAKAMNNLGYLYELGRGVAQSYPDAAKWYQAAAEKGIPYAMNNLGHLYEHGQGVAQSYPDAAKWYQAAAEKGMARARNNLALLSKKQRAMARQEMLARVQGSVALAANSLVDVLVNGFVRLNSQRRSQEEQGQASSSRRDEENQSGRDEEKQSLLSKKEGDFEMIELREVVSAAPLPADTTMLSGAPPAYTGQAILNEVSSDDVPPVYEAAEEEMSLFPAVPTHLFPAVPTHSPATPAAPESQRTAFPQ